MCPGNAPDCTDFNLDFKIFRGSMPPDPPREAIFYIFLFNLVEKDAKSHEIFIEQNWLNMCHGNAPDCTCGMTTTRV